MNTDRLAHLRRVAEAADHGGRQWVWEHAYPQRVTRVGDTILVAECFEDPDSPSVFAEFIATFDPPTVLSLLAGPKDAMVVIERMANGASREECSPELDRLLALARLDRSSSDGTADSGAAEGDA